MMAGRLFVMDEAGPQAIDASILFDTSQRKTIREVV